MPKVTKLEDATEIFLIGNIRLDNITDDMVHTTPDGKVYLGFTIKKSNRLFEHNGKVYTHKMTTMMTKEDKEAGKMTKQLCAVMEYK